jgi:hypothetical protein
MKLSLIIPAARRLGLVIAGLAAITVLGLSVVEAVKSRAAANAPRAVHSRVPRTPLYGLTVDDVSNLPQIVDSLRRLPHRPTTRIVFDLNEPAGYYSRAVSAMRPVSNLMGELLDSSDERRVSPAAYSARVRSYLAALGGKIDLWEIGNEVNGNWLGPYRDVEAKLVAAYNQVSSAHHTALTLYYNAGCGDGASELDPLAFSRRFVPARVRRGLNFVLLSYYEQECNGIRPSAATWTSYFARLHRLYPHAQLGFGEIGLTNPVDDSTLSYAQAMIRYYYGLALRLRYYVGGYFWWYGAEDLVPYSKPLFGALQRGFAREAAGLRRKR